jgi:hypothetical protein
VISLHDPPETAAMYSLVMESNAQPKQLTVAKIKLKQQEEFTLCGDPLFGHTCI